MTRVRTVMTVLGRVPRRHGDTGNLFAHRGHCQIMKLLCLLSRLFGGQHRFQRLTLNGAKVRECRWCKYTIPVRHRARKGEA